MKSLRCDVAILHNVCSTRVHKLSCLLCISFLQWRINLLICNKIFATQKIILLVDNSSLSTILTKLASHREQVLRHVKNIDKNGAFGCMERNQVVFEFPNHHLHKDFGNIKSLGTTYVITSNYVCSAVLNVDRGHMTGSKERVSAPSQGKRLLKHFTWVQVRSWHIMSC